MAGNADVSIALDQKRMEATVKQDFATLESIIADDLIYTHSTARIDTKESLIGNIKSGRTVYTGLEAPDVVAQDLGNALVRYIPDGSLDATFGSDGMLTPIEFETRQRLATTSTVA